MQNGRSTIIMMLAMCFVFIAMSCPVSAAMCKISWSKDMVETDLAGFKILVNGLEQVTIHDPDARQWTGTLVMGDGENNIRVLAYDTAGNPCPCQPKLSRVDYNPPGCLNLNPIDGMKD